MWLKRLYTTVKLWCASRHSSGAGEAAAEESGALPEYYVVTNVLDLHGFFPEQIEEMLAAFIENAVEQGYRECRIIHGKGKSRLKWLTRNFLETCPAVVDYYDAPPELGGWGATIVEIRVK